MAERESEGKKIIEWNIQFFSLIFCRKYLSNVNNKIDSVVIDVPMDK